MALIAAAVSREFKKKLKEIQGTQASLQSLSKWMVSQKNEATLMLSIWMEEFNDAYFAVKRQQEGGEELLQHMLNLLYLANDVMQSSARSCGDLFPTIYSPVIGTCFQQFCEVSSSDMKKRISRIVDVWRDRRVLPIEDLDRISKEMNGVHSLIATPAPVVVAEAPSRPETPASDKFFPLDIIDSRARNEVELSASDQELLRNLEQFDTDAVLDDLLTEKLGNTISGLEYFVKAQLANNGGDALDEERRQFLQRVSEKIAGLTQFRRTRLNELEGAAGKEPAIIMEPSEEKGDKNTSSIEEEGIESNQEEAPTKKKRRANSEFETVQAIEAVRINRPEAVMLIKDTEKRTRSGIDLRTDILGLLSSTLQKAKEREHAIDEKLTGMATKIENLSKIASRLKESVKRHEANVKQTIPEPVKTQTAVPVTTQPSIMPHQQFNSGIGAGTSGWSSLTMKNNNMPLPATPATSWMPPVSSWSVPQMAMYGAGVTPSQPTWGSNTVAQSGAGMGYPSYQQQQQQQQIPGMYMPNGGRAGWGAWNSQPQTSSTPAAMSLAQQQLQHQQQLLLYQQQQQQQRNSYGYQAATPNHHQQASPQHHQQQPGRPQQQQQQQQYYPTRR